MAKLKIDFLSISKFGVEGMILDLFSMDLCALLKIAWRIRRL